MVEQYLDEVNNNNNGGFWNPLNLFGGGGYTSQFGQEGDASIGSGLVNVTKKEVRTTNQNTFQTDNSQTTSNTLTDSRSFSLTNAPTLVFGDTKGNVGAATTVAPQTSVTPTIQTKKETSASQSASQDEGLDLNKIAMFAAIGGVVYLLTKGGAKIVSKTPAAKIVKKVVK